MTLMLIKCDINVNYHTLFFCIFIVDFNVRSYIKNSLIVIHPFYTFLCKFVCLFSLCLADFWGFTL